MLSFLIWVIRRMVTHFLGIRNRGRRAGFGREIMISAFDTELEIGGDFR